MSHKEPTISIQLGPGSELPKRRRMISKSTIASEPMIYEQVIKVIQGVGKEMERKEDPL